MALAPRRCPNPSCLPTYAMVLDWMRSSPGRAVSFDIWARGNYTRHVIHSMHRNSAPLIVPFRWVDEMRWAYRRLALLGVPIEFVYMGGVSPPQRILHLYPADGVVNEGGWGYGAALGDVVQIRGKRWFEVAAVCQSERFASLRKSAVKLGGALATVSAGIAAATAMDQRLAIPVAATAGAAAAASVLTDLWKERIKAGAKLRESAYFLALKLGLDKPTKVRRGKVAVGLRKMQRIESTDPGKLSDFHWLCPPTPGLQFLAFKK